LFCALVAKERIKIKDNNVMPFAKVKFLIS
jgi:hypothetical protein